MLPQCKLHIFFFVAATWPLVSGHLSDSTLELDNESYIMCQEHTDFFYISHCESLNVVYFSSQ